MNQINSPGSWLTATVNGFGQSEPPRKVQVGRRGFLSIGAAVTGGLLVGLTAPRTVRAAGPASTATVNVFVVIGDDNSITIITPGAEMGQGINGGLALVLAEELPLDLLAVKTVSAPYGPQYSNNGSQVTGGSFNMRGWFDLMRQAGATAREMLLAAAAARFPAAPGPLRAIMGAVADANGVQLATYGALAQDASKITLGGKAPLLSASGSYKVIGKSSPRPDIRLKVDGSAIFGIDVRLPNMVHGAVVHCPVIGGTVGSVPAAPAGTQVVNLGNAVAVTAANTWMAMNAARGLAVTWKMPASTALSSVDTSSLSSAAQSLMGNGAAAIAEKVGDAKTAYAAASKKLNLTYSLPYLAHACMEVLNCTVNIGKDAAGNAICQIWCPTQAPDWVAGTAAALTQVDPKFITVTTTYLGGGLGRKIEQDFVTQAIKVALAVGKPVKLTWPREEDFARDYCRPAALSRVQVGLDFSGNITGWYNRIVAPSVMAPRGWLAPNTADPIIVGSAAGTGSEPLPYAGAMPARLVEYVLQKSGIQVGFWRSVGQSISCFVVESAIDECALAAGVYPYLYRRKMLSGNPAALAVLDAAAKLGGWNSAAPPGNGTTARGIALSPGFGSLCAMVVEIAVTATGGIRVTRVSCAVDCGIAVNPDQVVAQMEGGILHGMNAARWGRMQYDNGICQVKNFGDYRMGRMADTPVIDVTIVNQNSPLGGVGEVGVPAVAPALANAYAALNGVRKRSLPLGI